MSRSTALLRILAPALLLAACGDPTGPGGDPITELPRPLTASEVAVLSRANAFGLTLMGEMATRDDRPNIVLSPLSASMALGMTLNGAEGATFEAMAGTLGFDGLSRQEVNEAYRGLIDLLTTLDPEVRFDIANALWANEDLPFHQAFFAAVQAAFDARVENADFTAPSTLTAINKWASDNTDGLIDRILDGLDPTLALLLLNAIYFDGVWTTRFDPDDTHRGDFRREDGSTVQVDMMRIQTAEFAVGGGAGYSAVELPYGGGAFSMVVLVPHGDTSARDVLRGLTPAAWSTLTDGLTRREMDLVSIPKFELAYDTYLNDALKAMGMDIAFNPGADFSRMSPVGRDFCIDFVRQKTFIEVDERGTRAAAVTAVGIRAVSFNGIVADRPFAFAIRERLSGTLLFVGMVGDPTAEEAEPEPFTSTCR